MNGKVAVESLQQSRKLLMNILKVFKPEQGDFRPTPEMMTVAQQIRHIALATEWFRQGAFGSGFDMDFAKAEAEMKKPCTLEKAMAELNRAFDDFAAALEPLTQDQILAPMPPNPILGEVPKVVVLHANNDHTAHHRGALTVYLRLLGVVPPMIYTD